MSPVKTVGNKRVELPTVFTGDIMPTNRSHIPTKDMAKKWPHLEVLVNELPPVQDCDIALLIGYDCDEALEPLKILRPKKKARLVKERCWAGVS